MIVHSAIGMKNDWISKGTENCHRCIISQFSRAPENRKRKILRCLGLFELNSACIHYEESWSRKKSVNSKDARRRCGELRCRRLLNGQNAEARSSKRENNVCKDRATMVPFLFGTPFLPSSFLRFFFFFIPFVPSLIGSASIWALSPWFTAGEWRSRGIFFYIFSCVLDWDVWAERAWAIIVSL